MIVRLCLCCSSACAFQFWVCQGVDLLFVDRSACLLCLIHFGFVPVGCLCYCCFVFVVFIFGVY